MLAWCLVGWREGWQWLVYWAGLGLGRAGLLRLKLGLWVCALCAMMLEWPWCIYILGFVREQNFGGGRCVGMRFKNRL